MKRFSVLSAILCLCLCTVMSQARPSFFEEHIDFTLDPQYFTINGIYSFKNSSNDTLTHTVFFPFAHETSAIDTIRIVNLNTPGMMNFRRFGNMVSFSITVAPNDTTDVNVYYRQKTAVSNRYILTSTQSWGEPLAKAVYTLRVDKGLNIKSFFCVPDSVRILGNSQLYYWNKTRFMPQKDFEILLSEP